MFCAHCNIKTDNPLLTIYLRLNLVDINQCGFKHGGVIFSAAAERFIGKTAAELMSMESEEQNALFSKMLGTAYTFKVNVKVKRISSMNE